MLDILHLKSLYDNKNSEFQLILKQLNEMKINLSVLSILVLLLVSNLASAQSENSVKTQNPIPELEIVEIERIDTVSIYDPETGKEVINTVKHVMPHVVLYDTTAVFDYDKYEERVTVVKMETPLYDFYRENEDWWFPELLNHSKNINCDKSLPVDTITVFDSEDYTETSSIVRRRNMCYSFSWGNYYFSDVHDITQTQFKELLNSKVSIISNQEEGCAKVNNYSCRIVLVPPKSDPVVYMINEAHPQIEFDKVYEYLVDTGLYVFIEEVRVNGERIMESLVLKVH